MTMRRSGAGVAVLGGDRLYAVRARSGRPPAGERPQKPNANPVSAPLSQLGRPANGSNSCVGVVLLPPQAGGVNGYTWLNSAEVYNPRTNAWVRMHCAALPRDVKRPAYPRSVRCCGGVRCRPDPRLLRVASPARRRFLSLSDPRHAHVREPERSVRRDV